MPANNSTSSSKPPPKDYQDLVRQVADRVWQLWQENLRRDRERRGQRR